MGSSVKKRDAEEQGCQGPRCWGQSGHPKHPAAEAIRVGQGVSARSHQGSLQVIQMIHSSFSVHKGDDICRVSLLYQEQLKPNECVLSVCSLLESEGLCCALGRTL